MISSTRTHMLDQMQASPQPFVNELSSSCSPPPSHLNGRGGQPLASAKVQGAEQGTVPELDSPISNPSRPIYGHIELCIRIVDVSICAACPEVPNDDEIPQTITTLDRVMRAFFICTDVPSDQNGVCISLLQKDCMIRFP